MSTIEIKGVEFPTRDEALQHADVEGGRVICIGGRHLVVEPAEAHRLESAGIAFAYVNIVERVGHPYGMVVTVPVN